MWFERDKLIRFNHCDPAAIIFYPQYFVLFHEVLENWWTDGLGIPYGDYIRRQRLGVPAVRTEAEFFAQAWLGDVLRFELACTRLGQSSLDYRIEVWRDETRCARGTCTVVQSSLETRKSVPFTGILREKIEAFLEV